MKVSGIICEYNPFHNGHLHHIQETKKNKATHIVAVMSGNFVQRGDVAIMDKQERARLAIRSGADLVIEIPTPYCIAPAEVYAKGAVYLLNALGGVDEISFGSECGDITKLYEAARLVETCTKNNSKDIEEMMKRGYTYPQVISSIVTRVNQEAAEIISKPNNTLAIEYMKAISKYCPKMEVFTVKREAVAHDSLTPQGNISSATFIREHLYSGFDEMERYMPTLWYDAIKSNASKGTLSDIKRLERILLYKLRSTSVEEIAKIYDIPKGLDNRIYDARMSGSLDEIFYKIKSKNYTMARIRRSLLNLLIGIKKEDLNNLPPYIRVLASNERGTDILSRVKQNGTLPYDFSLAKLAKCGDIAKRFVEIEENASNLYGLSLDKIQSAQKDYRSKTTIDIGF